MVRVLHFHRRMSLTELVRGADIGEERMDHHLNGLAVQRKTALCGLLQCRASRPWDMAHTRFSVQVATEVPHLCCFHLSSLEAFELHG